MTKNWAFAVGINQYNPNNFPLLQYAKRDAEAVRDFFVNAAGFTEVCLFTDDSPDLALPNGAIVPTRPTLGNLVSFLTDRFEQPFLSTGDNCWFFFAGHGVQYGNRDYVLPMDAPNPRGQQPTYAIAVNDIRERLLRSGADNVILILDACREEVGRSGVRDEWESQQGVITIWSCSPKQRSWEVDELQQGVFTYALLEALRLPGERSCATVERLSNYLKDRVPKLCQHYQKPTVQIPRISADPSEKHHFILLEEHAWDTDILTLKNDAMHLAFIENKLEQAEYCCFRANAAARGRDRQIFDLYYRIRQLRENAPPQPQPEPRPQPVTPTPPSGGRSVPEVVREPEPEEKLRSEKGIDYTKLRDLLKAQKWKDADKETYLRMLEVVGRKDGDYLRVEEIKQFPCEDLRIIDQLWVKYSNGKFGFSVQKKIWQECGSPTSYNDDWEKFGDRVGWRVNVKGEWLSYSDLNFSLTAPSGHLPSSRFRFRVGWWAAAGVGWLSGEGRRGDCWGSSLALRLVNCNL